LRSRGAGPLGLALGLLSARGLRVGERWRLVAWFNRLARAGFRCPSGATVADLTVGCPPAATRSLWEPLCVAALNTPPAQASAQVFANVLRAAFAGPAGASDFLVATTDLSAVYPDAALRSVVEAGGEVALRTPARLAAVADDHVTIALRDGERGFDAAVVAVGPHQIAGVLADHPAFDDVRRAASALAYEPIATAWLGYAARCPLPAPMLRLDDAPGQWLFDRTAALSGGAGRGAESLAAVVVSAGGPHDALDHVTLAAQVEAQLRRLEPRLPPVAWSRVIAERRATYACTPALARPAAGYVAPGLYLAGDYTDADFPATLEAACRSGIAAASALIADRGARSG
jgi:squalene-associated FAD-dependent desaturase